MRKIVSVVAVLVCLACSAMAEGKIGPFAALMKNDDANAFGGGLQYQWMFQKNVGVDARAAYLKADGGAIVPLLLGITGVLPLDKCSLHASAGGGYFMPKVDSGNEPDAAFGFYVGGGGAIPVSETVDIVAEVDYVSAKSEKTTSSSSVSYGRGYTMYTTYSSTAKLDISGAAVSVGILCRF